MQTDDAQDPAGVPAPRLLVPSLAAACTLAVTALVYPTLAALLPRSAVLVVCLLHFCLGGVIVSLGMLRERREVLDAMREELSRASSRYQAIWEHVVDGVLLVDRSGSVRQANPAATGLFGYEPEEMSRRSLSDLLAGEPDVQPGPGSLAPGQEHRATRRDGSTFYAEVHRALVQDGPKQLQVLIVRDVTQRRLSEKRLKESKQRYQLLADYSTDMISRLGLDGNIHYVSPACRFRLGFEPAALHGTSFFDLVEEGHRERVRQIVARLPDSPEPEAMVCRLRGQDGGYVWMETNARLMHDPERGAFREVIAISRDITDRKRAESERERLVGILEATTDFIITFDTRGRATYFNQACRHRLKVPTSTVRAVQIDSLYPEWAASLVRDEGLAAAARDGSWKGETALLAAAGGEIPVSQVILAHRSRHGEIEFYSSIMRDISERKIVDQMKDEFVSVVSHELRTPLTSIRGSLGLLAGGALGALPEKAQRMADMAVSNTDRLVRLINDILDIERLESGTVKFEMAPCQADALVAQATEVMASMAARASVRLEGGGDAVSLVGDADRLLQVLTNLMSNAIKFSPAGASVQVTASAGERTVEFSVRDHGRGIPADKLEHIFGRFAQVDSSDARVKGGSGLGLAICRKLVEMHGGRIWVESEVDRGSVFRFTIPTEKATAPTADPPPTTGP